MTTFIVISAVCLTWSGHTRVFHGITSMVLCQPRPRYGVTPSTVQGAEAASTQLPRLVSPDLHSLPRDLGVPSIVSNHRAPLQSYPHCYTAGMEREEEELAVTGK